MTKLSFKIVFVTLIFSFGISCTTHQPTSEVGTILNNPSLPKTNLVPVFDEYVPEETLGADTSLSSAAATLPKISLTVEDGTVLSGPAASWTDVFLDGGVKKSRELRDNVQAFGETALTAFTVAGVVEATDEIQTADLGTLTLVDTTAHWSAEYVREEDLATADSYYVRLFFRNLDMATPDDAGAIQAVYVFKTDNDVPVTGIFMYVNPDLLSESASSGTRLFGMAYDFREASHNILVTRVDGYNDAGNAAVSHVHYYCNLESGTNCSGQYVEIATPEPGRTFTHAFRYDWNDAGNKVCIADATFGESEVTLGTTEGFTGPAQPEAGSVSEGVCEISGDADWITYSYTEDMLPQRYKDSDPVGGTAQRLFQTGVEKDVWELVVPNLIVRWLRGEEFPPD